MAVQGLNLIKIYSVNARESLRSIYFILSSLGAPYISLDPILSQPNPVRPINPYLPKAHLNVILPPTLSLPSGLFGPFNHNPVNTCPRSVLHVPSPSYSLT